MARPKIKKFSEKIYIFSRIFSKFFQFFINFNAYFEKVPQILGLCPIVKIRSTLEKSDRPQTFCAPPSTEKSCINYWLSNFMFIYLHRVTSNIKMCNAFSTCPFRKNRINLYFSVTRISKWALSKNHFWRSLGDRPWWSIGCHPRKHQNLRSSRILNEKCFIIS